MVLGLKPVGKLDTPKSLIARQNHVLAWSSDSNIQETSNLKKGLSLRQNGGLVWSSAPQPYGS